MNIKLACVGCVTLVGVLSAGVAMADTLAVQDGVIFSTGVDSLNVIATTGATLPDACTSSINVPGAAATSDVVISGNSAFVKTDDTVTEVIISQCLPEVTHSVDECVATVDLASGKVIIPCLDNGDKIYRVEMDQRGNSMNWEVSFAGENGEFSDYRHGGNTN